jgi:AcrR family transcriptional regulator
VLEIGSLYRFFPNKESLADMIVVSARKDLDAVFDRFDADVKALAQSELMGRFEKIKKIKKSVSSHCGSRRTLLLWRSAADCSTRS